MIKNFICPDNGLITPKECLAESGCRLGSRCATRSYLRLVASERPLTWVCPACNNITKQDVEKNKEVKQIICPKCGRGMNLKFSCTQCIQGTMCAFLKLTKDYDISPDSRAFMINGTLRHANLEEAGGGDEFSEIELKFQNGDISGIADSIETENRHVILGDNKISGSYKIQKALGIITVEEPSGEVYKTGKRRGEQKMRKIMKQDDSSKDVFEWELQLNFYRIQYEKMTGKKIDELRIQCIARDGGTYIARSRGVFRNLYYFKLAILPDEQVIAYFNRKKAALEQALKQGCWKEICDTKENWDGVKCSRYCEVAEYCPYGKYLKEEREVEDMAIKNLSEVRQLPRLGKIRQGIKKVTEGGKEYPQEVDYFILDPDTPNKTENDNMIKEFARLFGEKPKSINIMFPLSDHEKIFPQFYKRYGKTTALQCKGDGITAECGTEEFAKDLKVIGKTEMGHPQVECKGQECPYFKARKCARVATLQMLIPELPGAGVWQMSTSSVHAIININSGIDYVKTVAGRAHMIPLKIERVPTVITHDGNARTHYIPKIDFGCTIGELQKFALIDPTKSLIELPEAKVSQDDIIEYTADGEGGVDAVNTKTGEAVPVKSKYEAKPEQPASTKAASKEPDKTPPATPKTPPVDKPRPPQEPLTSGDQNKGKWPGGLKPTYIDENDNVVDPNKASSTAEPKAEPKATPAATNTDDNSDLF